MSTESPRLIPWRVALVAAGVVGLVVASWWLVSYGTASFPMKCLFHQWTGLHCPGCGMTRATSALFQGNIFGALGQNPLGVIVLPVALVGFGLEVIGWVRNTQPPWRIPLGSHGAKILALVFIVFTVLRNLPWAAFSWMAPN